MKTAKTLLLTVVLASNANAAETIAHRGNACGETENTIAAVQQAWRAGADVVEVDVRVSSDGIAYLFHDDSIAGVDLSTLSFDEVANIAPHDLTLLQQLTQSSTGDSYLLDMKSTDPRSVREIVDDVKTADSGSGRFVFQSKSLDALALVKRYLPDATTLLVSELKWHVPYVVPASARNLARKLVAAGVDGVSMKGRRFVDPEFVREIKSAGLIVNVWTINNPNRIVHYESLGVDGVITDSVPCTDAARSTAL